jgi:SAM-dependent methyltransferase
MLTADNEYTKMQKDAYEGSAPQMNVDNHMHHNGNQDYWDILVNDTESCYRSKIGLDFGCGCGRNVQNIWMRFKRMDGVDISDGNLVFSRENLSKAGAPGDRYKFIPCNGVDLSNLKSDEYDFIMSTIVLQHIAVHEIRLNYFKEFFRIARSGALLSFQMGYGHGWGKADYYDNDWNALGTNSAHDTRVTSPDQLRGDLEEVGFVGFSSQIRPAYWDHHPHWIYVKALKP